MTAIWGVLEIDPTKDEAAIKKAYLKKLALTHPEDDPEGFKKLRTSYEEALKWAKTETIDVAEKKQEPIDLWMARVEDIYFHFSKRIDIAAWRELFEDDICEGLDTSEMALHHLLNFLSGHYHLPQEVWQLIDKVFCIQAIKATLIEDFPENFINYMIHQIKNESFIAWSLFKGEETADYDTYINDYLELVRYIDDLNDQEEVILTNEQEKQYQSLVHKLNDSQITYPHFIVQQLRMALKLKDREKAHYLAETLAVSPYGKDSYVSYFIGKEKWLNHEEEAAYIIWQDILKQKPDHYGAQVGMIYYAAYKKQYKEAKEQVLEMIEHYSETAEINKLMVDINKHLIAQMLEERKEKPNDESLRLELGWCYFQNKEYDTCRQLFNDYSPSEEFVFEYHNLKGRNSFAGGYLEEALPELMSWLEAIKALEDDGSERYQKRHRRIGYANFLVSMCHCEMAQKTVGEAKKRHYEAGEKFLEAALQMATPEHDYILSYKERLAYVRLKLDKNEACVDLCDEMIKEDKNFYLAYLLRQEAFFNLHNAQGVIDDYYAATSIYAAYIQPYLFAIEVFIIFGQYEEAEQVITRARGLQLESAKLDFLALKIRRQLNPTREDYQSIIKALQELLQRVKETDNKEIEYLDEVYLEIALSYMNLEAYQAALDAINLAIVQNTKNNYYKWIKADILQDLNQMVEALPLYESIQTTYENNSEYYYDIGRCLHNLGQLDKALIAYQKAQALNPNHGDVNDKLRKIYLEKFIKTGNQASYQLAVTYSEKQIALQEVAYYLINQGLTFLENYELEKAKHAFLKAIQDEPENAYGYNNLGYTYKILGDYHQAVAMYTKGIQLREKYCMVLLYSNLATCYTAMGQYDKAEACYQKCIESFPYEQSIYSDLILLYHRMGKQKEAIKICKERLKYRHINKISVYLDLGSTYANMGQYFKASICYKNALQLEKDNGYIYNKMGDFYFEEVHDYKKAVKVYEKALKMYEEKQYSNIDMCINLVRSYSALKNVQMAKVYFNKALQMIETRYETLENYLQYKPLAPLHYYQIGCLYLAIGDGILAKQYFDQIHNMTRCRHCEYSACYEALEGQGMIYMMQGEVDKAMRCFKQALTINEASGISKYYLKKLKNKGVKL